MFVKNYMEEVVKYLLDDVLSDLQTCKCDKCKNDISAIALNSLPPKYVVTQQGEVYKKVDMLIQQFEVDVIAAITKAAVMVKRNPKHDL